MNKRALIIVLALLCCAVIGGAWWIYFATGKLHWAIPVACTALPLLILGVILFSRWWLARRGEGKLERALVTEAETPNEPQNSARRVELERLRREFEQAVAALKRSKLADVGGSGQALYRLPWYTIIGPPASGKTTLLRNSGLKFPYLPGTGDRLKGIGGTRNCDWWLTNHAILLDTAGRWTIEEDEHDEWLTFLDLLKRNRRGQPLNGVIAAISIAGDHENSIAEASLEQIELLAARMRERLDEICNRLGVALPVYALFTKCDLLSGFVETFGELSAHERKQVWGFTAPMLGTGRREPGAYFAEQFDVLRETLEQHALGRMGEQAGERVMPRLYEFPAQFAALREKLTLFVDRLFDDSAYGETPLLRGAYFTSGTQESLPADLLYEELANELSLRPLLEENRSAEKKSYFLHDMLMRVVFADRVLASASPLELRRQQRRRRVITGALFAAALLGTMFPSWSARRSMQALARTESRVAAVQRAGEPSPSALSPAREPELSALEKECAHYESSAQPVGAWLGLDQSEALRAPFRRYYGQALHEFVARPLLNRSNAELLTIAEQYAALDRRDAAAWLDDRTRKTLHDSLELHLLLTAPHEPCVPNARARREWSEGKLLRSWSQAQPARDKAETEARARLLTRYVTLDDLAGDALRFPQNRRAVKLAREALDDDHGAEQLLSRVLLRYGDQTRLLSQLSGSSTVLESMQTVPLAFTKESWLELSRMLSSPESLYADDEDWLHGCEREQVQSVRVGALREAFQSAYLRRYQEHWQRFVGSVTARTPSQLVEAHTMLAELAGRPGVLGNLFTRVKEQTELSPLRSREAELTSVAGEALNALPDRPGLQAGVALAKGSKQALTPPVERESAAYGRLRRSVSEFVSFGVAEREGTESALDQYRHQIDSVLSALDTYRADDTKLDALQVAVKSAIDNTEQLLRAHAGSYDSELRQLLLPTLLGVQQIALRDQALRVERLWCDLVYRPFQEQLAGRYPLDTDSEQSASLAAFTRFFQPTSGEIWSFTKNYLGAWISSEGNTYRYGGEHGALARGLFRDELVSALNHAARLTQAFFPGNVAAPRVSFRVRVRGAPGYSLTSLRVGNANVRYDAGREDWVSAEWPGEQPSSGATLTVVSYQGTGPRPLLADGEWGLFRIFDARLGGHVLERTGRMITAGWKPKADLHYIKVDFASDDPRSPLLAVPFGASGTGMLPLGLPRQIARAGTGCQ